MKPNEIQTALASAVEEILETMCFTAVLASSEGVAPPAEPPQPGSAAAGDLPEVSAQLKFLGSPSGVFRVSVPSGVARVLAAGFLGREETEVSDSQAGEVICEVANMVCGAMLSRLESETSFHLFHPEVMQQKAAVNSSSAGVTRWFDLGDRMILAASLELQETA